MTPGNRVAQLKFKLKHFPEQAAISTQNFTLDCLATQKYKANFNLAKDAETLKEKR